GSFQVDSLCENNEKRDDFSGDPNAKKKDIVLGKGSTSTYGERVSSAANEAFSVLEGDVKKLIVNGILSIDFSDKSSKIIS
ncbi:hypothetical protein Golob_004144, partial [Gossypium lobatum]|nr:hypothetical protein [Gossypium lobatum]